MKKIGLALGGGGAKGISHIAFIKALDEMGIKPSVVAGTSIGAIIGAFYAAGISGLEMEQNLDKIRFTDMYKMMDFSILCNYSMLKGKGIEKFFNANIPAKKFKDLKIPLKITATDFWNRKEVIFDSGDLVPAVRSSMSVPAIFEPVIIDDMVLIDGGAVNPLPYDIIRNECDIVIAIDVSGEKTPPEHDPIPNMFESIMTTFQIMQASIVESKQNISKPDIYIKPLLKNIRILDFYRYKEIISGVQDDVKWFKHETKRLIADSKQYP